MEKLLVATHNQGKVREYRELLAALPLDITYLDAEGVTFEVEETGETFEENAVLKARAYGQATGLWTWADDSGLEVDALSGAPGVHSARYAGPGASDADRYHKLLDALAGVPWDRRGARFCCVVALYRPHPPTPLPPGEGSAVTGSPGHSPTPSPTLRTAADECRGVIAFGPAGENGFGFDPVFYMPEHGCTMAQLAPKVKNRISHRGRAARAAAEILREMLA